MGQRDRSGGYPSAGPVADLAPPPSGPAPGGRRVDEQPRTGIDPRVIAAALAPLQTQRPERAYQPDTAASAWPPRTRGPVPPREHLPADLNIFTAQDEIDAWAWEHDGVTEELAQVRVWLAGDPDDPEAPSIEGDLILARARARREARKNPVERGRRTSGDIDAEVEEALEVDGIAGRHRSLLALEETLLGRLFKAKDNINRIQRYIDSLPRLSDRP